MRLLISGSVRNPNTIGSFITSNFDDSITYEILRFPDRFAELLSSRVYRGLYHFFPSVVVRKMDEAFMEQVDEFRPTVVLIFKGMEISKRSLREVRSRGIKLVNFNFDHPFRFFSKGTGNRFVRDAIPYYDLHITYSTIISAELSQRYNVRTACIPFGYHLSDEQYEKVLAEKHTEINRVCFVGNPDKLRISILGNLLKEGIPIDLYGFGWEKFFRPRNGLMIHQPRKAGSYWADPVEFWKVLRLYRVQLNFFRPHNEGSHNLRSFEVPAVGGILLTPASPEQETFFDVGQEIFSYTDYGNLVKQCRWLLNCERASIEGVRRRAREKSVSNDYSYKRRTADLLNLLQDL